MFISTIYGSHFRLKEWFLLHSRLEYLSIMYLCFRVLRNIYTNVWIPLIYTWKCSVLPKELINPANCQVLQFSWLKIKSMSVNIDWQKCTQFSSNVNLLIVTCLVIPVQNSAVYSEPDEIFACSTLFSFCVNMHMQCPLPLRQLHTDFRDIII